MFMDPNKFQWSLKIGQGRPHVYLSSNDDAQYSDNILFSCINSTIYDQQCEDQRGRYLFDLIRLTNKVSFYRSAISKSLLNTSDDSNLMQLFDIAMHFALHNDKCMRRDMYRAYERIVSHSPHIGASNIIEMDGLEGLQYVANLVGAQLRDGQYVPMVDDIVAFASNFLGKRNVESALSSHAKDNSNIRSFRDATLYQSIDTNERDTTLSELYSSITELSFDEMSKSLLLDTSLIGRIRIARWGRTASHVDLLNAATELLRIQLVEQQVQYLYIFRDAEFPLSPDILIQYVDDLNPQRTIAALNSLSHHSTPCVRALAIQLLERRKYLYHAIQLLVVNYEPGDEYQVMECLGAHKEDEELHAVSLGLLSMEEKCELLNATDSLKWVYENNPSSLSRNTAVERLVELKSIPKWMIRECLWDCNLATRELVSSIG